MKAPSTKPTGRYAEQIDPAATAWFPLFKEVSHWVVCPHMKPDADTLGSSLGMAHLLRSFGCRAVVACADPVVERFGFMPGADEVLVGRLPDDFPADAGVVTLDAAEMDRLGAMAPLIAGMRPLVNLDHHISNQRFGTHNWIDVPSAATGELVVMLYDYFGVPLDQTAAIPLYAALITDTGFFRYPATTARTLEIAGDLVKTGIDFPRIISAIYERQTAGSVRLLGQAVASVRLEAGGKVAWTSISQAMFKEAGATEDEAEGIVETFRAIAGVEVLYILRESADGTVRVSLRAKGDIDVNAVARHFGGGGHLQASGCVIRQPLPEAERQLREVVLKHLEAH
jgi:phosphoesterase RecJ-like protein